MNHFPGGLETDQKFALAWWYGDPPTTLAGDFDNDGDVDGRDFLTWQRNPSVGNLSDWQANYGTSGLTAANTAVPEPSVLSMLFVLATASVMRRSV